MDFAASPASLLLNATRDERPIFVLEAGTPLPSLKDRLDIVFCNDAFRKSSLGLFVNNESGDAELFRQWVARSEGGAHVFAGHSWTRTEVCVSSQNIHVVTGMPISTVVTVQKTNQDDSEYHAQNMKALRQCLGQFVTPSMNAILEVIESKDWSRANLGLWPPELLEVMRTMLVLGIPIAMTIGEASLLIYNEAYTHRIAAGGRHPRIMGLPLSEAWPEGKGLHEGSLERFREHGYYTVEQPVPISGEFESFCTWTMLQLSPELRSCLILSADVTTAVLEERRDLVLAGLRKRCMNSLDFSSFCKAAVSFEYPPEDIPYLLCYSDQNNDADLSRTLETSYPSSWVTNLSPAIITTLQRVLESMSPVFLLAADDSLPLEWQMPGAQNGLEDKVTAAIATCLRQGPKPEDIFGILIVGLNPRRPLDPLHRAFANSVISELSAYALSSFRRGEDAKSNAFQSQRLDNMTKLFEMTDVGWFEYDSEWKLARANDAYFALSGYPRDLSQQTPMTFVDLVHPEDVDIALGAWSKLAIEALPINCEFRWKWTREDLTDDEKELGGQWIIASCLPVFENGDQTPGALKGAMGVMISSTETKRSTLNLEKRARALEQARDTEQQFRAFAENAPSGIYIYDRHQKLTYCNEKFLELIGAPKDIKYEDFDFQDYIMPSDLSSVRDAWKTLLEDHLPVSHHFRIKMMTQNPDGTSNELHVSADSYPILDDQGNVATVQGIMFNISPLKWAESIQRARVEEALESKRQQEHFIDMTSHELRNPLSAIVQCTEVVLDNLKRVSQHARKMANGSPTEAKEQFAKLEEEITIAVSSLRTVEECTGHMRRIADDVLALSKLDAKLLTITPTTVRFVDAMRDCTKVFSSAAKAENIEFLFQTHSSVQQLGQGFVELDVGRAGQVIANLCTNAIKFTRTEEVRRILIRVGVSRDRPTNVDDVEFPVAIEETAQINNESRVVYLWCSVKDTGSGLTEAQQALLFHRFSQAFAPKTHNSYGGSGLGLFISRSLCELQGGEIGVHSLGAGQGSTFAFYLKSLVTEAPVQHSTTTNNNTNANGVTNGLQIKPEEISVMVVEDNVVNSKVLVQQLKKQGFVVHVAYHGREALDLLEKSAQWRGNSGGLQINIITMDVEMPVMGGLECTRAIRQHEADGDIISHIPIIAVSANARQEQMEETRAAGMDDSIAKPFRIKDLLPKIQRLTREARANAAT